MGDAMQFLLPGVDQRFIESSAPNARRNVVYVGRPAQTRDDRLYVSGRFSVAERLAGKRRAPRPLPPTRFDWSGARSVRAPLDRYLRHGRRFYRVPERLMHERVELHRAVAARALYE